MTAKEYLQGLRQARMRLRGMELALDRLRRDLYSLQATDYSKDKVHGGEVTGMSDKVARMVDLYGELSIEWDEFIRCWAEAHRLIRQVPDDKQQLVLTERYINGASWDEIAARTGYSFGGLMKLHRKALQNFKIGHTRAHT